MPIDQKDLLEPLIRLGDYVTFPVGLPRNKNFHETQVDRSGDNELILRLPDVNAAIVINDRFYQQYDVEATGRKGAHRTFRAVWRTEAPTRNNYEVTLYIKGERSIHHKDFPTEDEAFYSAVADRRKLLNLNSGQQNRMLDAFRKRKPGYNYTIEKL